MQPQSFDSRTAVFLLALGLASSPFCIAQETAATAGPAEFVEGAEVAYVSDYISFVGSDDQGRVAFALDANRGRDGDEYQAERFVVMHDEHAGWIELAGDGEYENTHNQLVDIPDSRDFRFTGSPDEGLTLESPTNDLTLTVAAVPERIRQGGDGLFRMGSAAATLQWQGRTIDGRVIYEGLARTGVNRLSGISFGSSSGRFQGLYLRVGDGDDFYIHHRERDGEIEVISFATFNGQTMHPEEIEFEVEDVRQAPGFYRWPTAWTVRFEGENGPATLTAELHSRNLIVTWILGGFAMGIVEGTLEYDGRRMPVYGFGELIM